MYLEISRDSDISLTRQIYSKIVNKILTGELKSHEKLPSTRKLAEILGVSRIITLEVYDQLMAEGYVYSLKASGTYVNKDILYTSKEILSTKNKVLKNRLLYEVSKGFISFRPGIPDLRSVPIKTWAKTYKNIVSNSNMDQLDYQSPMGSYELRTELEKYLYFARGVRTEATNIIITSGAAQAFALLKVLLNEHEYVLLENPCSIGLKKTLDLNSMRYKPIDVDENGLVTKMLPQEAPKLIITTPSHQFPKGVILPIDRRIELVNYAHKNNGYIVEDDYDSEFRFEGSPIPSLQSLEPQRTIYVGTFSKTFSPVIRLGYMVLPDALVSIFEKAKYGTDIHSALFEQLTMAQLIRDGSYLRHIYKMRKVYAQRRELIVSYLKKIFKDEIKISGDRSGLHIVIAVRCPDVEKEIIQERLIENKVEIWDVDRFYFSLSNYKVTEEYKTFIIGYGNCEEEEIIEGLSRFKKALFL
jgi:GntR family transcriptional regulator/MocR family aminotransferase